MRPKKRWKIDDAMHFILSDLDHFALHFNLKFIAGWLGVDYIKLRNRLMQRGINFTDCRDKAILQFVRQHHAAMTIKEMADELEVSYTAIKPRLTQILKERSNGKEIIRK